MSRLQGDREGDGARALVLAPGWVVGLESHRLNNHIAANLHYLVLGRQASEIGRVHAEMSSRKRAGKTDWFEHSGASRFFVAKGPELTLKDELYFGGSPRLLEPDLRVCFRDRPAGRSLDIPANEAMLAWFGRLLPLLRRSVSIEEVRAVCDEDQWSFVEQLEAEGLLEVVPLERPRPRTGYRVRLLGHAGLSLETPKARVLFDPMFIVRTREDVNLLHELDRPIDAVVLSHPHWDHFNFDTLVHIPRETRMIVPRLVNPSSLENVDMAPLLRELGFSRVETLAWWESTEVADVRITATPFHGEQSGPDAPQDWMTYHVRAGDRSFFGAVDSCHTTHHSMDTVMRDVRSRLGPVDILFSPYSGFHYPIALFTRRPFYLGPGMEQYSGGPDDAARWTSILGAKVLVPYAGFVWNKGDYQRPSDANHRGTLEQLRAIVKAHPLGPLVVLEPEKDAFEWSGPGGELLVPSSSQAKEARR
ncbi:MBL fold metallo-hydrolase [Pendulispora albinea]|uniref:MBL fold metallo-hydrolase n=1 Tax=Pendulispora albinea TaxID=2741071 RepID=A0ABZ2LPS8_9BACT